MIGVINQVILDVLWYKCPGGCAKGVSAGYEGATLGGAKVEMPVGSLTMMVTREYLSPKTGKPGHLAA